MQGLRHGIFVRMFVKEMERAKQLTVQIPPMDFETAHPITACAEYVF